MTGQKNEGLTESELGRLDDMLDGLQDALIVRRSQRSSLTPTHSFQHGPTTVLDPNFSRVGAHHIAIFVRRRRRRLGSPLPSDRLHTGFKSLTSDETVPPFVRDTNLDFIQIELGHMCRL